jgi:3-oxoacyl-[acyl-carrier-protein] synthase-3
MTDVYIKGIEVLLPNDPIENSQIEEVLGKIEGQPSRSKAMILRNNGIKRRYYAIDPLTGRATHNNCQLTVGAIRKLCERTGLSASEIECLVCGTASPDQTIPNHAVMVHAAIGDYPCEVVSTTGVCCCGMTAFKYGYMSVATGQTRNAVATASEIISRTLRPGWITSSANKAGDLKADPIVGFDAEFLRWMLSDGAGAALLGDKPSETGNSLRVDWIDILSRAYSAEPCMYSGANKAPDGTLQGWSDSADPGLAFAQGYFNLKQDVKVLSNYVIKLGMETLDVVQKRRSLDPGSFNWFLPHLSSEYFRAPIARGLEAMSFGIPAERWFTNLDKKGNTGSASLLVMLEELLNSTRLRKGDKILCLVPESARFTYCWMQLTVV